MRFILSVAIALLSMGLVWADEASACCCKCCKQAAPGQPGQEPGKDRPKLDPNVKTTQVVLSVPDMTCASCVATVQKALSSVPGVRDVQVDLKTKLAVVAVEANNFDQAALLKALEKAGYPGKMLK